jgi:GTP-binding protein YchF
MEIGIIGLPQSGKKTLFGLLTQTAASNNAAGKFKKTQDIGLSKVLDSRLDRLAEMYQPERVVHATIKYILVPRLSKNSDENREALKAIANVDALCHVVRDFDDETVFHMDGSVDAVRDISFVESELLLNDLVFVENRLEKLDKDLKRKSDQRLIHEQAVMKKLHAALEEEIPLRTLDLADDEKKILRAYPLLSLKNMFIALNVAESSLDSDQLVQACEAHFSGSKMYFVQMSCKIEHELAEIDDPAEKKAFLDDLGISESALEKITQLSFNALDLISFFTVGKDECRSWTVHKGCLAPQAGGAVHSDIERGFIRAEHMTVDDLLALGSEPAVKEQGKFSLKGKDYLVQDGDILHFRFNV